MFRWHLALEGDEVLNNSAKDKLFKPRVSEEEGGDTYSRFTAAVTALVPRRDR